MLVEQIDRLLDEGGLIVFQVQTEFLQPLGMAIADPALQPAVGFLLAFHVLALPLGIVLRHIHLYFLAHMTLLNKRVGFVISPSGGRRNDTPLPGVRAASVPGSFPFMVALHRHSVGAR